MDDSDAIHDLESKHEMALVKLGVAEQYSWPLGMLAALVAQYEWRLWFVSVIAFVLVFWFNAHWYRKEERAAEDAYNRAAKIGRYYEPPQPAED